MGKAPLNNASIETVHSATTRDASTQVPGPLFSDGELGQLQEILFGQQQRSTNEQMNALQEQFETQLNSLSNVLNSRLNQLTETVEKSHKHFEQRLNDIKAVNQSTCKSTNEGVAAVKTEMLNQFSKLSDSSSEDANRLHAELEQYESKMLDKLNGTKRDLQIEINRSVKALNSTKLDKQDLVQILSNLSELLSDKDSIPPK